MKGRKWKILYGLFLAVVSCLLYNTLFTLKNANAAVVDLSGFEIISGNNAIKMKGCRQLNCNVDSNWSSSTWNLLMDQTNIYGIKTDTSKEWKQGDIAEFTIEFRSTWEPNISVEYFNFKLGALGNSDFDILNIEEVWDSSYTQKQYEPDRNLTPSTYYEYGSGYLYKMIKFTLRARRNGTYPYSIGTLSDGSWSFQIASNFINTPITEYGINIRMLNFVQYRNIAIAQQQQDEQDRNNIESQSEQTNNDANNSEQQMSSGTSSLISVVTSFSNAMIGVRRTNCKLPRMTAYDFDLGELDLCTYSPPAWIQTITSAVVSLIVVRLAYKIFKRIMGIAKGISK